MKWFAGNGLAVVSLLLLQCHATHALAQVPRGGSEAGITDTPTLEVKRLRSAIRAELIDANDYYLRADGSQVRLLRKQNVFALALTQSGEQRKTDTDIEQKLKLSYGANSAIVRNHNLGGLTVVQVVGRALPERSPKNRLSSNSAIVSAQQIESIDSAISSAKQVFANSRGEGDLVLLPKVTVKLAAGIPSSEINRLASLHGLELQRKLRISGNVYSLKIINQHLDAGQQLSLVRSVAATPSVLWAEPQFLSKPFKTTFEPNDALFDQQWHLRNTGVDGSRCDTDCDANNAWDLSVTNGTAATRGGGMVIAIIDDGVQLNHPDLQANIWSNVNDPNGGGDNDGNGYIDDTNGWDFIDDSATNPNLQNANFDGGGTCATGVDSQAGPDNDPSPQATVDCYTINGDPVEQDDHGTAVAGLAAAVGNNSIGIAGTAFAAKILPLRVISSFDSASTASFCIAVAEAMAYAGRYADVVSNSWGMNDVCLALEDTISDVAAGQLMDGGSNISKRPTLGSPVLFAAGNSGSGWIKFTASVNAGEHAYEWRFLRSDFPELYDVSAEDDSAWIDKITFPDNTVEEFDSGLGSYKSGIALNSCNANCSSFFNPGRPMWGIESGAEHVFSGSNSAVINTAGADCGNSYLSVLREDPAGQISFWVWVSTNTESGSDKFEFLIDGKEVLSFGDRAGFVDNQVAYPANLGTTIAVGASTSGDLSGATAANKVSEQRAYYSQHGPNLNFLAPSSDQHLGITTTDRTGLGNGYNTGQGGGEYSDTAYTNSFGGTSAATPVTSGIAAAVIAVDQTLTASAVTNILQNSADKIGSLTYSSGGAGRNDQYGYGRVNMLRALQLADGSAMTDPAGNCSTPDPFSYSVNNDRVLGAFSPIAPFCPAKGELPQTDDLCIPIIAANNKIAVICI